MSTTNDPNDPRLRNIGPDGMQESYLVLSEEERARGFVRPVRRSYRHVGITNDLARTEALKLAGSRFEQRRFAVFGRDGLPCYHCDTPILKAEMARRIYWCPDCQR